MHPSISSEFSRTDVIVRWRMVAFLMALCFVSHLNRVSITVAADERIMGQYGITPTQMGAVYSAFLLLYTLFMVPGGFLIDRIGPRKALLFMGLTTAGCAAMTGALGLRTLEASQMWFLLLVLRGFMGLCAAPLHPGGARAIGNWIPNPQQGLANGLVTGAGLLGIAFTYPLFGRLIDTFDWTGAFFVTGACTALIAAFWANDATDYPWEHRAVRVEAVWVKEEVKSSDWSRGWVRLLTNRSLILLTLSYAAVGYLQYLFFYWIHFYFEQVLELGKEQSRLYAAFPVLAMAAAMPLGGSLSDSLQRRLGVRAGRRVVTAGAMALSAALLGLALIADAPNRIVLLLTLSLGVLGLCEGPFWVTAIDLGRFRGGTAAAIMNTGGNGIGLFATFLTPVVGQQAGWEWGLGLGAAICVVGAVCWFWIEPFEYDESKSLDKVRRAH